MSDQVRAMSASRRFEHWTWALAIRAGRMQKRKAVAGFIERYGYEPSRVTIYGAGVRSMMDPPFCTRAAVFAVATP
jgi:hypothetical protein